MSDVKPALTAEEWDAPRARTRRAEMSEKWEGAARLRQEIDRRYRHLKDFQRAIKEKVSIGGTYASVHAYYNGDSTPGVEFLTEAASLLGVGFEWLATGNGPRFVDGGNDWLEWLRSAPAGTMIPAATVLEWMSIR